MKTRRAALIVLGFIAPLISYAPSRGTLASSPRPEASSGQPMPGHQIAIRTIDPADEDWSDLSGLARLLSDVRLVVLGEATHGDGATFLAKTRFIEFLHQRLGFDLLVFESGFYDCSRAWPPRAGSTAMAAFENCAWALWSQRRELEPLVSFLDRTQAGPRPLTLAGLDPEIGVPSAYPARAHELRRLLEALPAGSFPPARVAEFLDFSDHAGEYRARTLSIPGVDSLKRVVATAKQLAIAVRRNGRLARRDRAFWALVLENFAAETQARLITQMYSASPPDPQAAWEANLARDAQMARNLAWVMDEGYPGRKAIVWVATAHAGRELHNLSLLVDGPSPFGFSLQEVFRRRRTLGDDLRKRFGSSMYSIAFTAHGGTTAGGPSGRAIPAPSSGSLEDFLGRTAHEYAFLDLRHGSRALAGGLVARPFGHAEMRAVDWSRILDAIFFIRTMTPSTPKGNR